MKQNPRATLREYYDAAASNYLKRASGGVMGWMRKRELALTLNMIPQQGTCKTLDAGCGPGYYSGVMRDRGFDVTAVDISPEMVKTVQKLGFPAYVMDIEHSSPPEGLNPPFGFIFCAGVLEFAEEVPKFLGALHNLAEDGAEVVLVAPMEGMFGRIYKKYLEHKGIPAKLYSRRSIAKDLKATGFQVTDIKATWPICLAVRAKVIK